MSVSSLDISLRHHYCHFLNGVVQAGKGALVYVFYFQQQTSVFDAGDLRDQTLASVTLETVLETPSLSLSVRSHPMMEFMGTTQGFS